MLPYIDETRKSRVINEEFLGIRRKSRISERESYDSYNLTNDDYPILCTRKPRAFFPKNTFEGTIVATLGGDVLAVLTETQSQLILYGYVDGRWKSRRIGEPISGAKYNLVRFGNKIICYPRCYAYDFKQEKGESFYSREIIPKGTQQVVIKNYVKQGAEFIEVDEYFSVATEGYSLKVTRELDSTELSYKVMEGSSEYNGQTYIGITGIGLDIKHGDTLYNVAIEGFESASESFKMRIDSDKYIVEDGAIYIPGLTSQRYVRITQGGKYASLSRDHATEQTGVRLWDGGYFVTYDVDKKRIDYVVECKNRLWACVYDGNINEIWATKLGSYSEWRGDDSTDIASEAGYVSSVGSYGPFTGACVYGDNPIFFKEDFVHKVYVSSTGAHQIYNVPCKGVEEGASASIAEIGGYLCYKARGAFVRFDGTSTEEISEPIDGGKYKNAVAGIEGDKYVAACQSSTGEPFVFVYDAKYGTWQREHTESAIRYMEEYRGRLCLAAEEGILYHELREGDESAEEHVRYMYESGDIGFSNMEKKYICRLEARVRLELGASFNVWIQYDSDGRWISLRRAVGERCTPKVDTVHVMPRRCDHFRLRLTGKGEMKLYGITRVYEEGESV